MDGIEDEYNTPLLTRSSPERLSSMNQDEDGLIYARVTDCRGQRNVAYLYILIENDEGACTIIDYCYVYVGGLTRAKWRKRIYLTMDQDVHQAIVDYNEKDSDFTWKFKAVIGWEMMQMKLYKHSPGSLVFRPDGSWYQIPGGKGDAFRQ